MWCCSRSTFCRHSSTVGNWRNFILLLTGTKGLKWATSWVSPGWPYWWVVQPGPAVVVTVLEDMHQDYCTVHSETITEEHSEYRTLWVEDTLNKGCNWNHLPAKDTSRHQNWTFLTVVGEILSEFLSQQQLETLQFKVPIGSDIPMCYYMFYLWGVDYLYTMDTLAGPNVSFMTKSHCVIIPYSLYYYFTV